MNLRTYTLIVSLFMVFCSSAQNGKKIYADYHGVRYSRQHDGRLGRWEMHADTRKSSTGIERLCYNADFFDENGRHNIAATAYPQIGMHSDLDPHSIEYQMLAAKTAGIDGFFIEWGYMGHENDILLRTMQPIAAKYGFEIGVNWCDGWLYYDWITRTHPHINTREAKTEHYTRCFQYLVDSVLSGPTAPIYDGRPLFYLFGPGAKPEEYKRAVAGVKFPEGMKAPAVLRRWAEWGELQDDKYIPVRWSDDIEQWHQLGTIPTAWIPARVRPRDAEHPNYDHYATKADILEFMKPFRDSIWMSNEPSYTIKSGFVTPGMDNSGCAGWGRGHFFYIPREEGDTYEQMWKFNMQSKDSLDVMFIASWSDYTEGHEIEPTIENGDRELRTTLRYASIFKEQKEDATGLDLPLKLFELRKRVAELKKLNRQADEIDESLNDVALLIANAEYSKAALKLSAVNSSAKKLESKVKTKTMAIPEEEIRFSEDAFNGERHVKPELKLYLSEYALNTLSLSRLHTGYIEFEYFDDKPTLVNIYSRTNREPKDLFGAVAKFMTSNTQTWRKARVKLHQENILYDDKSFTLMFKGDLRIRNVSINYTLKR